jgi:hypothetical protein
MSVQKLTGTYLGLLSRFSYRNKLYGNRNVAGVEHSEGYNLRY